MSAAEPKQENHCILINQREWENDHLARTTGSVKDIIRSQSH